jgi:hypothetical protein
MARSDRVSLTYTADIGDIRRKLKQIPDLTAAEVRQATSALNKATRQTQRAAQRGRRDSQAFSTSLAAVGAAATGAVVGLGMMAQSVADARNNLTDLSTRSGVARETIAGLKVAADGSGVSFSKIEGILGRLPKTMSDVQAGSKKQADAFRALGVSVTNADGTLRDADAVFRESIQAIGGLSSETDKAAAATQLFGRQGTYLLQALGDPAALESFVSLAGRSAIATSAAADAAAQYQRDMAVLNLELESAKATLSDALGLESFPLVVAGAVRAAQAVFEEFFGFFEKRFGAVAGLIEGLTDLDFDKTRQSLNDLVDTSILGDESIINTAIEGFRRANAEVKELGRSVGEIRSLGGGDRVGGDRLMLGDDATAAARAAVGEDPTAKIAEQTKAQEQLRDITVEAQLAMMSNEAQLMAQYDEKLEQIAQLAEASGDYEEAHHARLAVTRQMESDLHSMRMQQASQLQSMYLSTAGTIANTLAQSFEQGSAAAYTFYVVAQGVAAAQAIIQSRAAAMAALAPPPLGLGPVAGAALATATRVKGAVEAAAIMATTAVGFADTPGLQRVGYGGMTASFAPGDLVVAGRDESDLVRQMQRAGIGAGGTQVLIRDADSHRGRYGRDPLRAPDRYGLIKRRAGRIPGRR